MPEQISQRSAGIAGQTVGSHPLLSVFLELRVRNLEIGVAEFLDGLRLLATTCEVGSRDDLILACQALWGSSREEQRAIEKALHVTLPARLTSETIAQMRQQRASDPTPENRSRNRQRQPSSPQSSAAPKASNEPAVEQQVSLNALPSTDQVATKPVKAPQNPVQPRTAFIDLAGEVPIFRRHAKRSWRYFRRMARVGPSTEADIPKTIRQIHRDGVFLQPILVPRRRNLANIVILMDQSESMTPFRMWTNELVQAARQSGLASVTVLFFSDTPTDFVFQDRSLTAPVDLQDIVRRLPGTGIMVVSDAGAARGGFDRIRVDDSIAFVRSYSHRARVAWINPVPTVRWEFSTAESISAAAGVKMFSLERMELYDAMNVLRGRSIT
ncbi:VWA domain-containing protein [Stieleria varia]|uniref:VWA domain containing CoxE-like protein n=1 Tax=Stieleria varia TaxID=2528005 RepID=A0A5C6B050_9BACT|nr:VWA domain-containing protein [Stieleria varia]TWU04656.1 VWA domain containing CoxE-like protein [Stieleria varia]